MSEPPDIPGLTSLAKLAEAAECLKILAHPHRLRMVEMLLRDRYTVGDLADGCGIPGHMASGHLRLMQRCGLLEPERDGRKTFYRVVESCLGDLMNCVRKRFGPPASA